MKPVRAEEVLSLADYERVRPRLRPLFMAEKDRRRLAVGEHLTLLFENGQTVWYQVHEMIRAERLVRSEDIQAELDTYNELLPQCGELAATLLIEYAQPAERDPALRGLLGLEKHLWLIAGQKRVQARFDLRQMTTDRISSVQFVRFPVGSILLPLPPEEGPSFHSLPPGEGRGEGALPVGTLAEQFLALAAEARVAVEVDHPQLSARAQISGALAAVLAQDLAGD